MNRAVSLSPILVFCVAGLAQADGVVLAPVAVPPMIPDQEALIHYADGEECLVIETRFVGQGKDFAWVVPLPSVPEISPVTAGLFPTLRFLFAPRLVHDVGAFYLLAIYLTLTAGLLAAQRYDFALLLFFGACLWSIVLPSFMGTQSVSTTPCSGGITLHDRRLIGAYDVVTISSADPDAMLKWLNTNGFTVNPQTTSAIKEYVKDSWVFVASRLRRDEDSNAPSTPHPLAFRFPTTRPVYPLRLTATGSSDVCRIDLYVFGPGRAETAGFYMEACDQPEYPIASGDDPDRPSLWERPQNLLIRHPDVRRLVDGAPVATRLSGKLTPAQMKNDAYLRWEDFERLTTTVYSRYAATATALNASVCPLCVLLLVTWALHRKGRLKGLVTLRVNCALLILGGGTGVITYAALPKTETKEGAAIFNQSYHRYTAEQLSRELTESQARTLDLPSLRRRVTEVRRQLQMDDNALTGEPCREEDSPGNYTVRISKQGPEYVWYDAIGDEHAVPLRANKLWPTSSRATRP